MIDSGVDYYHPALGGGYGAGYKVAGGYDLVGSGYTGGTPQPEEYPYDECNGHGTLVAGLIAGSDNEYDSPGVAPDATIYAYKVFGCSGSTPDSVIIDAMLRAVSDGCDVINLSLGECVILSGADDKAPRLDGRPRLRRSSLVGSRRRVYKSWSVLGMAGFTGHFTPVPPLLDEGYSQPGQCSLQAPRSWERTRISAMTRYILPTPVSSRCWMAPSPYS